MSIQLSGREKLAGQQALAAINQLVEAGILIERTGYRRNRVFVAEAVLAIVNRPFSAISEV